MQNKKIIISHATGNANVRALVKGVLEKSFLNRYYTCIAVSENSIWVKLLAEFRKRSYTSEVLSLTSTRPFFEFCRLVFQRLGIYFFIKHEKGLFSIDKVNRNLDRYVSNKLKAGDVIYGYEDSSLASFEKLKKLGDGMCIYDLPIGYWRAMRELLEEERLRRPEWAITLTGFKDTDEKVARKDRELHLANLIYVASSFTKQTLQSYPGKLASVKVVPYGFPPIYPNRKYRTLSKEDKLKLLFVGGLSQRKGIANVFEAVDSLDNVSLTVIGRKPVKDCKPLNDSLEKHRYIESLAHSDILEEMRTHDILLFPSLFEGYGLVITEAMSQGTPVITTTRTCGADFIEDGINGWLVEPGSTKDIINKLITISSCQEQIAVIGKKAQEKASKLPMATYGQRLISSLEENILDNAR